MLLRLVETNRKSYYGVFGHIRRILLRRMQKNSLRDKLVFQLAIGGASVENVLQKRLKESSIVKKIAEAGTEEKLILCSPSMLNGLRNQ